MSPAKTRLGRSDAVSDFDQRAILAGHSSSSFEAIRSFPLTLAPSTPFDPSASMELVEFFRGLADPVRLEMIRAMAREREVACTTYERRFSLAKSTISYHIRTLRMAGMITVRKEGPYYYYQLEESTFERLAPGMLESLRRADR